MDVKPQDVRLYGVDTSKGRWGIFVQSVVAAQDKKNLFVKIILERNIDKEHIISRRLVMLVAVSELETASGREGVLNLIRNWVETTEGDGSIDGRLQSR